MPRAQWSLRRGRPRVEVVLTLASNNQPLTRALLADSGAGSANAAFELLLSENDCLLCNGYPDQTIRLAGAYAGLFPTYYLSVQIPALGFSHYIRVVATQRVPAGFDGIACFPFLRRFTFGNFGQPDEFGIEL